MNEMARFEIEDYTDRDHLCITLAKNGYPVVVKELRSNDLYVGQRVVVYEKEDKA